MLPEVYSLAEEAHVSEEQGILDQDGGDRAEVPLTTAAKTQDANLDNNSDQSVDFTQVQKPQVHFAPELAQKSEIG